MKMPSSMFNEPRLPGSRCSVDAWKASASMKWGVVRTPQGGPAEPEATEDDWAYVPGGQDTHWVDLAESAR